MQTARVAAMMRRISCAREGDAAGVACAAARVALIADLEREIRANVNLKHALANLVAQWGGLSPDSPAYQQGLGFLLERQFDDGSFDGPGGERHNPSTWGDLD